MADDRIKLIIEALLKDKEFKKVMKSMSKDMKKGGEGITKSWASVVTGFNQGLELMKKGWMAVKGLINIAKEAAEYKQGMDALARNTGQNADKMVAKLKEVTKGTVANKDVMLSANRLVALNVTRDVDKMAQLFEVARVKAKAMGISTAQAINDISTGIGRNSPLILDNLGIITKGWAEEAKAAGQAYDQQFMLNKILEQGAEELKRTGAGIKTSAETYQTLEAVLDDLRLAVGQFIDKGLKPLIIWTTKALKKINEFLDVLNNAGVESTIAEEKTKLMVNALKDFGVENEKDIKKLKTFTALMRKLEVTNSANTEKVKELKNITSELFKVITGRAAQSNAEMFNLALTYEQVEKSAEEAGKKIREEFEGVASAEDAALMSAKIRAEEEAKMQEEKNLKIGEDNEIKKTVLTDYYTFLGEQRELDLMKEMEAFEMAKQGLNQLLMNGTISRQQYYTNLEKLNKKHQKNMVKINDEGAKIIMESWNTASRTIAGSYSASLADMIVSGNIFKKTLGDFLKELIQLFLTLIAKAIIFKVIMAGLGGIGGFFFNKGGAVPCFAGGGKVAYAADGLRPRGSDTVPAMLTPGERVLTVDQNKAFESLLRSLVIPTMSPSQNVVNNNNNVENTNMINNTFNNEFDSDGVEEMIDFSQRTGTRMLKR